MSFDISASHNLPWARVWKGSAVPTAMFTEIARNAGRAVPGELRCHNGFIERTAHCPQLRLSQDVDGAGLLRDLSQPNFGAQGKCDRSGSLQAGGASIVPCHGRHRMTVTVAVQVAPAGSVTRAGAWLVLGQVSPSTRSYPPYWRVFSLYW